MIETLEAAADADRALVFGIGGGGDVVSTIPTARFLELLGVDVILGGVTWIPVPRDVKPGPRPIDELAGVEAVGERIARVSSESETVDGVSLAEAGVASVVANEVLALDVSAGAPALAASLAAFIEDRSIDLVVGIDAGGDAIADGDEPGLRSPLTDAVGTLVLTRLPVDGVLGVLGYGSDGELTRAELDEAVAELAAADALLGAWGITPTVRRELERVLECVATEASRLPVEAARGDLGVREIRGGRRQAVASPASPITYYFDPAAVADRSVPVSLIEDAPTLEAAADALRSAGLSTEFDLEQARLDGA